jgi:hypothetical protein
MSEKKPRSDSKLDSLPESRVVELRDGLLGGWRYEDARAWLGSECGVSCSLAVLSAFYKRHCAPVLRERRQVAALKAETLIEDAGKTDWSAATLELVRQAAFDLMSGDTLDVKTAEKLLGIMLKSRDQDMGERKLAVLERKAAQADQAATVSGDGALSAEEKAARLKQIFGMG